MTNIVNGAMHVLKVWPEYFDALESGTKTFEFRRDDRTPRYEVGDTLILSEWDRHAEQFTGREVERRVTYVARGGVIPEVFCCMSLEAPECMERRITAKAGAPYGIRFVRVTDEMVEVLKAAPEISVLVRITEEAPSGELRLVFTSHDAPWWLDIGRHWSAVRGLLNAAIWPDGGLTAEEHEALSAFRAGMDERVRAKPTGREVKE